MHSEMSQGWGGVWVESSWLMGAADCYNLEPVSGEAVHAAGASLEEQPETLKGKALLPALSLQCSLSVMLNIVPARKGSILRGSGSIFAE